MAVSMSSEFSNLLPPGPPASGGLLEDGSSSPEVLRVLAIGSPAVVQSCVMTLFSLGYARPEEWSRQLPTVNTGEVMRILTKRVMSLEQN
jgi:hypothetical protein